MKVKYHMVSTVALYEGSPIAQEQSPWGRLATLTESNIVIQSRSEVDIILCWSTSDVG